MRAQEFQQEPSWSHLHSPLELRWFEASTGTSQALVAVFCCPGSGLDFLPQAVTQLMRQWNKCWTKKHSFDSDSFCQHGQNRQSSCQDGRESGRGVKFCGNSPGCAERCESLYATRQNTARWWSVMPVWSVCVAPWCADRSNSAYRWSKPPSKCLC